MAREINRVGVVGLGTMGAGIVEVLARNGQEVVAVEISDAALQTGRSHVDRSTARAVSRGRLEEADRDALLRRITFTTALEDLAPVDLVVEAVPERLQLKRELFARLDRVVRRDAVLATNTSSLSVTEIAVATEDPSRVVGMHFFNPAPVLRLVEVVRTVVSDADVVDAVTALAVRLRKEPVVVRDRAGFIANALLFGYLNHAVRLLESRYASREDIDAAMTLGANLPMGPLTLLDLIGLDTSREILETMYRQTRDPLHAPAPLLDQLVTAGRTGRKSGGGFYAYASLGSGEVVDSPPTPPTDTGPPVRLVAVVGDGEHAAQLAEVLAADDHDVVRFGPGDLADERLREAEVVVVPAGPLSVVQVAAATSRPSDVVGLHVVGSPLGRDQGPRLVEVVRSVVASHDAISTVVQLCRRAGLHPVTCDDRAGLLVARLLVPHLNDAARMVETSYASVDDVDTAMTRGCGYPAGPFALIERMGLDQVLAVQRMIYDEVREPGLAPAPLLEQLALTGRGFTEG